MCFDPISGGGMAILSGVMSAGQSIMGFIGKNQEAQRQNQVEEQNRVNALAAQRDEQRQTTTRLMQEQDATAQRKHLALVEEAEKSAEVSVSAAGANVAGLSVDNLIADVTRRTSTNLTTLDRNYEMTAAQLQAEADASTTRAQSRINSVSRASSPSILAPLMGVVGAGVKAYGQYEKATA